MFALQLVCFLLVFLFVCFFCFVLFLSVMKYEQASTSTRPGKKPTLSRSIDLER